MALTAREQEIFDFAVDSLPKWFIQNIRPRELINAFVKIFDRARQDIDDNADRTLILQAVGDFLDLHGADRGILRRENETDASYRARIRNIEDAVTRPALLAATRQILEAVGIVEDPVMVELRRDRAFFGTYTTRTGTGGTFTTAGGRTEFLPDVLPALPIEVDFPRSGAQGNPRLTLSGAADAANNGVFEVNRLVGNAMGYDHGGVAAVDAGVSWTLTKHNAEGYPIDRFRRAYLGRGYRMHSSPPPTFVIILPFGCTSVDAAAVADMLRIKKAAGVVALVECRGSAGNQTFVRNLIDSIGVSDVAGIDQDASASDSVSVTDSVSRVLL